MGIPVKLKQENFVLMGEKFNKGDIFNAPHEALVSFMCDQEGTAERVNEDDCNPEKAGTMKRTLKKGSYNTKVMTPVDGSDEPILTKPVKAGNRKVAAKTKSNVKAPADAPVENT